MLFFVIVGLGLILVLPLMSWRLPKRLWIPYSLAYGLISWVLLVLNTTNSPYGASYNELVATLLGFMICLSWLGFAIKWLRVRKKTVPDDKIKQAQNITVFLAAIYAALFVFVMLFYNAPLITSPLLAHGVAVLSLAIILIMLNFGRLQSMTALAWWGRSFCKRLLCFIGVGIIGFFFASVV